MRPATREGPCRLSHPRRHAPSVRQRPLTLLRHDSEREYVCAERATIRQPTRHQKSCRLQYRACHHGKSCANREFHSRTDRIPASAPDRRTRFVSAHRDGVVRSGLCRCQIRRQCAPPATATTSASLLSMRRYTCGSSGTPITPRTPASSSPVPVPHARLRRTHRALEMASSGCAHCRSQRAYSSP